MHRDHAKVVRLVVVDDAAGESHLSSLAVDHVVRSGDVLLECRGVGDQLEDRAGLVDVADRVVLQQRGRGVAGLVGIEGGTDGEGQDLTGCTSCTTTVPLSA